MPNAWIEHVRKYARDNNISYGCAVSEARASYANPPARSKTPKPSKPATRNYRKKVTPKQRERAKVVKQNIVDRINKNK
jgi:hypothetical protein